MGLRCQARAGRAVLRGAGTSAAKRGTEGGRAARGDAGRAGPLPQRCRGSAQDGRRPALRRVGPRPQPRAVGQGKGQRRGPGGRPELASPPRPPLPRAAVRPWPPGEEALSSLHLWPPRCQVAGGGGSRGGGWRAAAGLQRPPWRPPRARVTHVEAGVLGAEEREEHGERPQPRAAVVLLGGDRVAALRAERVEVREGHRAARPARPEPQGRGQEQRPGGAARHRWGSAGGDGAGTHTAGTRAGHSGDGAGTERRRGRDAGGRNGALRSAGAGARPRWGVIRWAGRACGQRGRTVGRWTPGSRPPCRAALGSPLSEEGAGRDRAGSQTRPCGRDLNIQPAVTRAWAGPGPGHAN